MTKHRRSSKHRQHTKGIEDIRYTPLFNSSNPDYYYGRLAKADRKMNGGVVALCLEEGEEPYFGRFDREDPERIFGVPLSASQVQVGDLPYILLHKRVLEGDERVSASYSYYDMELQAENAVDLVKGPIALLGGVLKGHWYSIMSDDASRLLGSIAQDYDGSYVLWLDEPDAGPMEEEYDRLYNWVNAIPGTDFEEKDQEWVEPQPKVMRRGGRPKRTVGLEGMEGGEQRWDQL